MPTYIYKTFPNDPGTLSREFEVTQKMSDPALTEDPDSGEPVRRIITGGIGLKFKGLKKTTIVNKRSAAATACGCASGKPHRHTH